MKEYPSIQISATFLFVSLVPISEPYCLKNIRAGLSSMEAFSYAQLLTKEYKYIFLYYCMPFFSPPLSTQICGQTSQTIWFSKISESLQIETMFCMHLTFPPLYFACISKTDTTPNPNPWGEFRGLWHDSLQLICTPQAKTNGMLLISAAHLKI